MLTSSNRHSRSPSPSTQPSTACSGYPARSKPSRHPPQHPGRRLLTPATRSSARSPSPPALPRRIWTDGGGGGGSGEAQSVRVGAGSLLAHTSARTHGRNTRRHTHTHTHLVLAEVDDDRGENNERHIHRRRLLTACLCFQISYLVWTLMAR